MIEIYLPGLWQPTFRSHCYSKAAEKIRLAEEAMSGRFSDVIRIYAERAGREIIWC